MTLETFARVHDLPARWLELRKDCEDIVARPDFWYRADLQDAAKKLALEASDMLVDALARETGVKETNRGTAAEIRNRVLDKTIADSFPASDPPSSIPDPAADSFGPEAVDSM